MSGTLRDVKDIPKKILNKKNITLYKAFLLHDDDQMDINVNIDILSLSIEDAIARFIQPLDLNDTLDLKGKTINLALLTFNNTELLDKSLVDQGDIYYDNGSISITLSNKLYNVSVADIQITDLTIDVDPKTEIKTVTELKYIEVKSF